jgi:A/G-specific adenine glycosylase
LLQRTNADQVLTVYQDFANKYKTADQFIKSPENIFLYLGLNWRYDIFVKLCHRLKIIKTIPETKEALLELPGIGEYVASAFLSLYMYKRESIIDSNIVRIYGRYFGFATDGETRRKKWFIELADKLTPEKKFKEYNYGLLDFTRIICKRKPDCMNCILNKKCFYYSKTI